jgi:hypothetical protein
LNVCQELYFRGQSEHSPPSRDEVKNDGVLPPLPPRHCGAVVN